MFNQIRILFDGSAVIIKPNKSLEIKKVTHSSYERLSNLSYDNDKYLTTFHCLSDEPDTIIERA